MPEQLLLSHRCCPGDVTVMTALVRDLALAFPGRYKVAVATRFPELWSHNPYICAEPGPAANFVRLDYGDYLKQSSRGAPKRHFLQSFSASFRRQTGVDVPLLRPRPDLHLGPEEEAPLVEGRYWALVAGGKTDFTAKHWVYTRWQELADGLGACGLKVVQVGAAADHDRPDNRHYHPPLAGTVNLVGKTSLRDFLRLVRHAEGVICPVTFAMHAAAAFEKPCVVIAGGREEPWWEAYCRSNPCLAGCPEPVRVPHRFLHTVGLLPCGDGVRGCWRSKASPLEHREPRKCCNRSVMAENGQRLPECLRMIQTSHALAAVLSYYEDGTLPPIGPAPIVTWPDGRRLGPVDALINMPSSLPPAKELAAAAPPPATIGAAPPAARPVSPFDPFFDHPRFGGKITAFVLCFSEPHQDHHAMHRRCLDALAGTTSADRLELRIGSNQACAQTVQAIEKLIVAGRCRAHYQHRSNDRKYPLMRQMFHDPDLPIETPWLLWLDDDTFVDKDPHWLGKLAQTIVEHADCDLVGPRQSYGPLRHSQLDWLRAGLWYRGRPFQTKGGVEAPNGDHVIFATGSFWAATVAAVKACGVPDERLGHQGGDYTIGEQLHQGGYRMKNFSGRKEIVLWSAVKRRGITEPHPGLGP